MGDDGMEAEPWPVMSEREKFLLDLRGILRIPAVLSPSEVAALNAAFEANVDMEALCRDKGPNAYPGGMTGKQNGTVPEDDGPNMLDWPEPYGHLFQELIACPKLVPSLNTLFGPGYRMADKPFLKVSAQGTGGQGLHGFTSTTNHGTYFYHYVNGQIRTGMAGIALALKSF